MERTSTGMPVVAASACSCSSSSQPADWPTTMSTIRASGLQRLDLLEGVGHVVGGGDVVGLLLEQLPHDVQELGRAVDGEDVLTPFLAAVLPHRFPLTPMNRMGAQHNRFPDCSPGGILLGQDRRGVEMRPLSERSDFSVPRYRVEERQPDLADFIVGFADTPAQYRALLARRAAQLTRSGVRAELVVIDQESEAVVVRRDVWVPPESRPQLP